MAKFLILHTDTQLSTNNMLNELDLIRNDSQCHRPHQNYKWIIPSENIHDIHGELLSILPDITDMNLSFKITLMGLTVRISTNEIN